MGKMEIAGDSTTVQEEIPMPSVARRWTIMLLSVVWLSSMGLAIAGEPMDLIRQTSDQTIKILDDPQLQGPKKQAERMERLRKMADEAFDWQEMARRALATHWRERTPQQQQEFTGLFKTSWNAPTSIAWTQRPANGKISSMAMNRHKVHNPWSRPKSSRNAKPKSPSTTDCTRRMGAGKFMMF